nr:helix-turn-helix transcriptional regulator [uncultured Dethiosulfovibrio sp.]
MSFESAREGANLKRSEVAEIIGTTRVTVYRWERGINEPDISTMRQLAKLYGCSVDDLVTANPTPPRDQAKTA